MLQYKTPNFAKAKAPELGIEELLNINGFNDENSNMLSSDMAYLEAAEYLTENFSYITDFYRCLYKTASSKKYCQALYRFTPNSTSKTLALGFLQKLAAANLISEYYESCYGSAVIVDFPQNDGSAFTSLLYNGIANHLFGHFEEIYIPKGQLKSNGKPISPAVVCRKNCELNMFFLYVNTGIDYDCPTHNSIIQKHCRDFVKNSSMFKSFIVTTDTGASIYKSLMPRYSDKIYSVTEIAAGDVCRIRDRLKGFDNMGIYKLGRPIRYNPFTHSGTKPPEKPGEYYIKGFFGILYIGETCNLRRRMNEHIRSKKLKPGRVFEFKIADSRSTSESRRKHERKKIQKYKPKLNRSNGGEGRIAQKK